MARRRVLRWFLLSILTLAVLVTGAIMWLRWMPGSSFRGPLPPPSREDSEIERRLRESVTQLAGPLAPRSLEHPQALEAAAQYIEDAFREAGYKVTTQPFEANGAPVRNIEAELQGGPELIVVGAHYDSFRDVPGANDNGSGVAAVLEIARLLHGRVPKRTVRFVLFVNEEPPYYQTPTMGSRVHAKRAKERGESIALMLNIDMIGCYRDGDSYSFPMSALLGSKGDFIAFFGDPASRGELRQAVAVFRTSTQFPSEGMIVPPQLSADVASSDHGSYWREGYRAVYVTDTGPMRGCPWHTARDITDAIDFGRTARVVAGLSRVVAAVAGQSPTSQRTGSGWEGGPSTR